MGRKGRKEKCQVISGRRYNITKSPPPFRLVPQPKNMYNGLADVGNLTNFSLFSQVREIVTY